MKYSFKSYGCSTYLRLTSKETNSKIKIYRSIFLSWAEFAFHFNKIYRFNNEFMNLSLKHSLRSNLGLCYILSATLNIFL